MLIRSAFLACKRRAFSFKFLGSLLVRLGTLRLMGEGLATESKSVITVGCGRIIVVLLLFYLAIMSIFCILAKLPKVSALLDVFENMLFLDYFGVDLFDL